MQHFEIFSRDLIKYIFCWVDSNSKSVLRWEKNTINFFSWTLYMSSVEKDIYLHRCLCSDGCAISYCTCIVFYIVIFCNIFHWSQIYNLVQTAFACNVKILHYTLNTIINFYWTVSYVNLKAKWFFFKLRRDTFHFIFDF